MSENFSEGFDLDAISNEQGSDVIYELGGGITTLPVESKEDEDEQKSNKKMNDASKSKCNEKEEAVKQSEEFKKEGNEMFKNRNFLDAIDYYTDAIEHCPGMKGDEMLKLQKDHEEQEREKATQRYNRDSRRRVQKLDRKGNEMETVDNTEEDNDDSLEPKEFVPPVHEYGEYLSVYYSNRAACYIQLGSHQEAISDCNVATLVQPNYVKAYIRRMSAYENTEQTELALKDAKKALELQPSNREISAHVKRLEKLEAIRMEKMKEETMGKLKELGNSILGNFGMSLDNFKAVKDPNTGSYSISYQN